MFPLDPLFQACKFSPPPLRAIKVDITPVENELSVKDFSKIIDTPELFWQAFCKVASEIFSEKTPNEFSTITAHNNSVTLSIQSRDDYSLQIKSFVEEIRKLLANSLSQRKEIILVPVRMGANIFMRQKSDLIELFEWESPIAICLSNYLFKSYVHPCLPNLCQLLGASCTELLLEQKIKNKPGDIHIYTETVISFKITWSPEQHLIYPIPAKKITPHEGMAKLAYEMYQKEILCDLSLVTRDGSRKVHAMTLFMHGGECLQTMLTSSMKEGLEKVVLFKEYSLKTVQAMAQFIYLGEEGLSPKFVQSNEVDLYELFVFANMYQIPGLIECTTNLISLISTPGDIETLQKLAKTYANDHLRELYKHLSLKNRTDVLKV